jgi:hypothetical protein
MTLAAEERSFWDVPEVAPDGAWREKRNLAAALRELAALCVTTDAPESVLAAAAASATKIAERLRVHPRRTFKEAFASCTTLEDFAVFADRGTLAGKSNPFAPPMRFNMEGETAVGLVSFGPPFEGLPGCVHGGLVAAAFDQLFGYLQIKRGVGSLTGELTVRYRRPTPLDKPLRFEASLARTDGRRSFVTACVRAGDTVTAEATGIFIELDGERMHSVIAGERPAER